MCYSKEVSLAVGGTMILCSAYTWHRYVRPLTVGTAAAQTTGDHALGFGADVRHREQLRGFFAFAIFGHLCIAGHQLFEFLAILTGNAIVYRIGLITSISCAFFAMRSLEELRRADYGSRVVAVLIALVGIEMFTHEMRFENRQFWVRGEDHMIWGILWTLLFIYWNLCILHVRHHSASSVRRRHMLLFGWAMANLSYLLSLVYAFAAALSSELSAAQLVRPCWSSGIATRYDLMKDVPSIWCAFAVVQALVLPWLFAAMSRARDTEVEQPLAVLPRSRFAMAGACILLTLGIYYLYPLVHFVAVKMVTR